MKLKISDSYSLPPEAVTETFLDLGQRGAGKTNTAAVIFEELHAIGAPCAVLTPIDVWWGLKTSRDGKGPGLPIYIFGGQHADLPLTPTAGKLMADVLIEQRISCVICTQGFSGKERAAFTTDFAERLLDKNREPLHLIVEEADAFIPQKPYPGEERMLGAMDRLIRWGRSPSAIGGTFISQRSAKINKDITTQCSVLLAHRTVAPQDIEAIKLWFKYHPDTEKQAKLLAEIASLPKGVAFIYSPAWLDFFGKVQVRLRSTFDSAATPKLGEKRTVLKTATVDLAILEQRMAETIEKVKQDDPKELRKQIAELKRQLSQKPEAAKVERVEVPGPPLLCQEDRDLLNRISELLGWISSNLASIGQLSAEIGQLNQRLTKQVGVVAHPPPPPIRMPTGKTAQNYHESITRPKAAPADTSGNLPIGERKILTACGQYPDGATREQLTILSGYKRSSRDAYIQRLVQRGLVEVQADAIVITQPGFIALGADFEPLPTGKDLQDYWLRKLPAGEGAMLKILIDADGQPVDREHLTEATGYKRSSRDAYLQRLSARQLVVNDGRGTVRASDTLFE